MGAEDDGAGKGKRVGRVTYIRIQCIHNTHTHTYTYTFAYILTLAVLPSPLSISSRKYLDFTGLELPRL